MDRLLFVFGRALLLVIWKTSSISGLHCTGEVCVSFYVGLIFVISALQGNQFEICINPNYGSVVLYNLICEEIQ